MRVLIVDPVKNSGRDGWHPLFGDSEDALNGNISRVFLTGVPMSVPTTKCRQPDSWSCGPYSLAECLGQPDGEDAREWLLGKGLINPQVGTYYSGIVGYLNANGYTCDYDGRGYDGIMVGDIYSRIANHLRNGFKIIFVMHGTSKGCRNNYWTNSGHYITCYGIEDNGGIVVDGWWGQATTKAAQKRFGTTQDGIISNQNVLIKPYIPASKTQDGLPPSWEFVPKDKVKNGSELVRAIQKMLGIKQDGHFGMGTITNFQKWLGVDIDGYIGGATTMAFQRWLNS